VGITAINAKKGQLRELIDNANASPEVRLRAAKSLLKLGATEDSIPFIRRAIHAFEFNPDSVISRRAEKLKQRFEEALELRKGMLAEKRESAGQSIQAASPVALSQDSPQESIPGLSLLPPDAPDEFWDTVVYGKTRRALLGISLSLPAWLPYTRQQIIEKYAPIERILPGSEPWRVHIVRVGEVQPGFQDIWI